MSDKTYWYKLIADEILEVKTFDLLKNNPAGCKTVKEMIAFSLLSDLTEYGRHLRLDKYIIGVINNLEHAIDYLKEKHGVIVYKFNVEEGGNYRYDCLTIDKEYCEARDKHSDRIINSAINKTNKVRADLLAACPEKLERLQMGTNKALLGAGKGE